MGMAAHAALVRDDGSVFVHLHPMGTVSMASLAALPAAPAQTPGGMAGMAGMAHGDGAACRRKDLPFPAFPRPGPYRLFVQVKSAGEVRTGVFDLLVR